MKTKFVEPDEKTVPKMLKQLHLIIALLLVAGCASVAHETPDTPAMSATGTPEKIAASSVGETVQIQGVTYAVVEEYVAASGRKCKKLLGNSERSLRVTCQKNSGDWYVRKPLAGDSQLGLRGLQRSALVDGPEGGVAKTSHQKTIKPALLTTVDLNSVVTTETEQTVATGRSITVLAGENLWRFSKRVTGNATNWQKIALYNGIDDVATLRAGSQLVIPPDLTVLTEGG